MHVAECAAVRLKHAMCGEIAQSPAETPERLAELRRCQMHGDVALGLHAEQRRQPSGTHRVAGKAAQRMSARDEVADSGVLRMLEPAGVWVESVYNCGGQRVAIEPHGTDAERGEAVGRLGACRI